MFNNLQLEFYLIFFIVLYLTFIYFTETRNNHGYLIALGIYLFPITLIFYLIYLLLFNLLKLFLYPYYSLQGKQKKYYRIIKKLNLFPY
jgi:hypothetical protein